MQIETTGPYLRPYQLGCRLVGRFVLLCDVVTSDGDSFEHDSDYCFHVLCPTPVRFGTMFWLFFPTILDIGLLLSLIHV